MKNPSVPITSRRDFICGSLAATLFSSSRTFAQGTSTFPNRPITWVVPYPPGGFGDVASRFVTARLAALLGQSIIVENRSGASGQIAAAYALQQPADGHTVFFGDTGPFALNAGLYPKLAYSMERDFLGVSGLFTSSSLLLVPIQSQFKNFSDLVRGMSSGSSLTYGSYGIGSHPHIWTEMFARKVGANLIHVPYRGAGPAIQDLVAGRIDLLLDVFANGWPFAADGRVRPLALVGPKRLLAAPEVPTIAELGHRDLEAPSWAGIVVRTGTPMTAVTKLQQSIAVVLRSDEFTEKFGPLGVAPAPQSSVEFNEQIRTETQRWTKVIKAAAITAE